jgi:phage head maturation protease
MKIRAVICTHDRDRVGDIVEPSGMQEHHFAANPVVLWNHNRNIAPIAKALELIRYRDRIEAEVEFADTEMGRETYKLYKGGFLKSWSVGFAPIAVDPLPGGGRRYTEWELLEFSAVPVPENPAAVTKMLGTLKSATLVADLKPADILSKLYPCPQTQNDGT